MDNMEQNTQTLEFSDEEEDLEAIWEQVNEIDNIFNDSFREDQLTPSGMLKNEEHGKSGELFSFQESFQMDNTDKPTFDSKSDNPIINDSQTQLMTPNKKEEVNSEYSTQQEPTTDSLNDNHNYTLERVDTEDMKRGFLNMESFDQEYQMGNNNESTSNVDYFKPQFTKKEEEWVVNIDSNEKQGQTESENHNIKSGRPSVENPKKGVHFQSLQKNFMNLKEKLKKVLKKKNQRLKKQKQMRENLKVNLLEEKLQKLELENKQAEELKSKNQELTLLVQELKDQLKNKQKEDIQITVTDFDEREGGSMEKVVSIQNESETDSVYDPSKEEIKKYSFVFDKDGDKDIETGNTISQKEKGIIESDQLPKEEVIEEVEIIQVTNDKYESEEEYRNEEKGGYGPSHESDKSNDHVDDQIQDKPIKEEQEWNKKSKLYRKNSKSETNNNLIPIQENLKKPKSENQNMKQSKDEESIEFAKPKFEKKISRIATWDESPERKIINKKFIKPSKIKKRKKKKKNKKLNKSVSKGSPSINMKSCDVKSNIIQKRESNQNIIHNYILI